MIEWAAVATLLGVVFWLFSRPFCSLGLWELAASIAVGAGSGALAAAVAQTIQRNVRERAMQEYFGSYAGTWNRVLMYQYRFIGLDGKVRDQIRLTETEGIKSQITYMGGQRLELQVNYDRTRGFAASSIDFPSIGSHVGSGIYYYVEGRLSKEEYMEGIPHHGRFTMHLNPNEPNLIILLYDGLIPDPNARGYEVWRRVHV